MRVTPFGATGLLGRAIMRGWREDQVFSSPPRAVPPTSNDFRFLPCPDFIQICDQTTALLYCPVPSAQDLVNLGSAEY